MKRSKVFVKKTRCVDLLIIFLLKSPRPVFFSGSECEVSGQGEKKNETQNKTAVMSLRHISLYQIKTLHETIGFFSQLSPGCRTDAVVPHLPGSLTLRGGVPSEGGSLQDQLALQLPPLKL